MKKIKLLLIFLLLVPPLFSGCGNKKEKNSNLAEISGRILSSNPLPDYQIILQDTTTRQLYSSRTDNQGNFSLRVKKGGSFTLHLLNELFEYKSPVIISQGTEEATMGLRANNDLSLGEIIISGSEGSPAIQYAKVKNPGDYLNNRYKARAREGIPLGLFNLGKGIEAQLTPPLGEKNIDDDTFLDQEDPDRDGDGLIDIFDADNDGNGIVDELEGEEASTEGSAKSGMVSKLVLSLNLNLPPKNSENNSPQDNLIFTLEVIPNSAGIDQIIGIKVLNGASFLESAAIVGAGSDKYFSEDEIGYPPIGSLWKESNYRLTKWVGAGNEVKWIVRFNSSSETVKAGTVFKFRINYADGSSEDLFKMINYLFSEVPRVSAYTDNQGSHEGLPDFTEQNPIVFFGDDLTLEWNRPKDEAGNEIKGLDYSLNIFYFAEAGAEAEQLKLINSLPLTCIQMSDSDYQKQKLAASLTKNECLPSAQGDVTVKRYQVEVTAQSKIGDKATQVLYFERGQ